MTKPVAPTLIPYFPKYQFAASIGPHTQFRAILPKRLWDGRWAWLKKIHRQKMAVHAHLQGGGTFWVYSDQLCEKQILGEWIPNDNINT